MKRWKMWAAVPMLLLSLALFGCAKETVPAQAAAEGGFSAETAEEAALSAKSGETPLLDGGKRPSDQELKDIYQIDVSMLGDSVILVDKNYAFCMALLPAQGKANDVKNMMSAALDSLATQLELYAPEQSERVKNRLETVRGDYLIYIGCADNNAMLDALDG